MRKLNGSYTVEAALLMPLLIMVLMAVIYAGFYMHDKIILRNILAEIAEKDACTIEYQLQDTVQEWKEALEKRTIWYFLNRHSEKNSNTDFLAEEINRRCMLFRVKRCTISRFPAKTVIKAEAESNGKGFIAAPLLKHMMTIKLKCKDTVIQPAEFARAYRETGICMDEEGGIQMLKQWIKE